MHKFIKKPIVIEAFQMTKERRWDNSDWPKWLHAAWQEESGDEGSLWCVDGGEQLYCNTLEGRQQVTFNDYIIKGINGEIYPCKPDIFDKTYYKEGEKPWECLIT